MLRVFLYALLLPCYGTCFSDNSKQLTLADIYASTHYKTEKPNQKQWQQNGESYTIIEASASHPGSTDIIRYETNTGKKTTLVSAKQLVLTKNGKPVEIDGYTLSQDHQSLLLLTNTKSSWRHEDSGDYWLIDLKSGVKKKLGGKAKPSSLYFAKLSPDGNKAAYVYEHNLYVEYLDSGNIQQLTHDGSETIANGAFDWVYEEEFGLSKDGGFRWGPDSKQIAFWRTDMQGVGTFNLINYTDKLYSTVIPQQYPKAGTTNSAIKTGVIQLDSGKTTWFIFDGKPRDYYLPRMDWAGSSEKVAIQHLNRKQNQLSLYLGDPKTGELKLILKEKNNAWLEAVDDLVWFKNGEYFTWPSGRDGWNRVYIYSSSGKQQRAITPKAQDAIGDLSINVEQGWLYFRASPDNATQRYLYRAKIDGQGSPERVTPEKFTGTNRYDISPNQQWAFHRHSRLDTPYTVNLISLPDHQVQYSVIDNTKLKTKLSKLPKTPHEFFKLKINQDKLEVDGWMIKPANFNPKLKYPLLIWVYAEPWRQTTIDHWEGDHHQYFLWHKFLAEQGYLVVTVDNRGTPAPKGTRWRKAIYGKIGTLTSADQAAAIRKIVQWDFVDEQRVAIWGRSGGGTHVLNALFRYPNLYKVGIAVSPVPDLLLYDTIYQERYTGVPPDDLDNYIKGSPITYAHQLKGPLLIIHGTGDDNVHYQGTEKLILKLVEHNLPFSMMPYPNSNHNVTKGKNTTLHKRSTMFRFLKQHVSPGGIAN